MPSNDAKGNESAATPVTVTGGPDIQKLLADIKERSGAVASMLVQLMKKLDDQSAEELRKEFGDTIDSYNKDIAQCIETIAKVETEIYAVVREVVGGITGDCEVAIAEQEKAQAADQAKKKVKTEAVAAKIKAIHDRLTALEEAQKKMAEEIGKKVEKVSQQLSNDVTSQLNVLANKLQVLEHMIFGGSFRLVPDEEKKEGEAEKGS